MASSRAIRAGRAFLELSVTDAQFRRGLERSIGAVNRFGASLKRLGSFGALGGGLSGLTRLFAGAGAGALFLWPVKLAAGIEKAAASLAVFTGSAKSARDMLLDLQDFSAISLVPFEDLAQTSSLLLRYGIAADDAVAQTKALAVIAQGNREEFEKLALAYAQVASATRLTGEEDRQFKNTAFNPLRELAQQTGQSMEDLRDRMKAGGIPFQEVANALSAAVGPGGRFHGLLEAIGNTLIGKLNQGLALFKRALIPLGDALLPSLKSLLDTLLDAAPALEKMVKQNAHLYVVATIAGAAVIGLGAALVTLGLSTQVVAIAAAGLLKLFVILVNPVTLLIAAVAGLTIAFFKLTTAGQRALTSLARVFAPLVKIAREAFTGIAQALAAGEIQAAANVLWTGLKLAWMEGTESLRVMWQSFKNDAVKIFTNLMFDVQKLWVEMASELKAIWADLEMESRITGERIGHWLTRSDDPQLAAEQDRQSNMAVNRIRNEGSARQQQIEKERRARLKLLDEINAIADQTRDEQKRKDIQAAAEAAEQARKEFDAALKKAAGFLPAKDKGNNDIPDFREALNGLGQLAGGVSSSGTFLGRLAPQILGGPGDTAARDRKAQIALAKEQRDHLREIRRKTFLLRTGNK